MPRLLALEWDQKEARVAVAHARGAGIVVEHAFVVPLVEREHSAVLEADVGAAIGKALAERGLSRTEALVAVGRASIELRFLTTPPVPEDELPDIVRFQALRQFTTLGDDWPLDFVPLAPNADGGTNVLAAAISPDLVNQIRQTATAANVSVTGLVLRPFAAASLLRKEHADGKCRMIVDLLRDEADMTVLLGPQVIFPRTVRLPTVAEPEALARALLAEGRRTMIAAQNQLGGRRVEEVVIFGDGQHHSSLKQLLEKELSLTVKLIDPFEWVEWDGGARAQKPEYPGTFAPLLGVLCDAARETRPEIDFLHPRKKPEPPNRRRTMLIAGGAIAALVLIGFAWMQLSLWSLDGRIAQLKKDVASQKKLADKSVKPVEQADRLEQFSAGDVTWLDELALMSKRFPKAEAARVREMHWRMDSKAGGGKTTLKVLADKPATITATERALRDKRHSVLGSGATEDDQAPQPLQWASTADVSVEPGVPDPAEKIALEPATPGSSAPAAGATT
ncbi:MAG TPA: hypothetical protein VFV87_06560, partial [Pirellulaceae bacterium]|nr:hypothetical protein [Pirellulaceae bacterium]